MDVIPLIREQIPLKVIYAIAEEFSWASKDARIHILEHEHWPWLSQVGVWGERLLLEIKGTLSQHSSELVHVSWDYDGTKVFGVRIDSMSTGIARRLLELSKGLNKTEREGLI